MTNKEQVCIFIIGIIIIGSLYWLKFQWRLCMDMGFDFWYCVAHIS